MELEEISWIHGFYGNFLVHIQIFDTTRNRHRITNKCHNQSIQTNPWHHEEKTEYDQEMPKSKYTDKPMAPRGKDTE